MLFQYGFMTEKFTDGSFAVRRPAVSNRSPNAVKLEKTFFKYDLAVKLEKTFFKYDLTIPDQVCPLSKLVPFDELYS